jgi:tRNA A-37 threonylcarbamoyl transferase component Bud32
MEQGYEAFLMADRVFYDTAHSRATSGTGEIFRTADRALPDGWRRSPQDDWFVFNARGATLPEQGWKIHVSASMENADRILDAVWNYCIPRGIEFKFLKSPTALLARVSKYARRGYSGKLVTIYPADDAALETILRELGEILDGEPNPYILSDLRWGKGPLFVRYGSFRNRFTVDEQGNVVGAIANPDGVLVADRRGPVFSPPSWVTLPEFLAPHLAARNAVKVDSIPYSVERVLHFSNGGGIYLARDKRTGEQVVLKEGRPYSGLDAYRRDAVQRLDREYETLRQLEGVPGIPKVYDTFWLGEHRFLAMEYIDGTVLSTAIVRSYPLIDHSAGPAEYAKFADWAVDIYRQVETTVTAMHERGIVYGDMHLFNIMVREDNTIALIDFEVAAPVEEAVQPGLGNQGFAPPRGVTGVAIDRYGLACLRLALFLPMTNLLWLHRPKAVHYAKIIKDYFPVSDEFLAPALEVIAPGIPADDIPEVSPDPARWPQLRDDLARAIVASATPERDDRLFPGDPQQFGGAELGIAYGAAGVLYALSATGGGRYPALEQWLLSRATAPPEGTLLGLYDGLHGVAYTLDHLGHRQLALDTVDVCLREKWETLGLDLFGGLPGIGLNLLHLADRTGEPALRVAARRAAELVAERLGDEPDPEKPAVSNREQGYAGLMRGRAGAALLLMRAYDDTGEVEFLDRAAVALRQDLHRCVFLDNGALEVNEGWRTMPYLEAGSVGVGLVLDEYLARRPDEQFAAASQGAWLAAQSEMYILPGLFSGRAGILLYLLGRSPERAADPLVAKQIRGLAWHALPYAEGMAFPGNGLLRLSMDVATGTAGVLLALGAALHDQPVRAPLLAAERVPQAPVPSGAGS